MRVVFMGTPALAATVLAHLDDNVETVAVFTRPDAIRGRGKKLVGSPVRLEATKRNIPVFTPTTLKGEEAESLVRELAPDAICVAAFGMILPKQILEIPPLGCLNVHSSLLPRWRGAAPIERAILAGDERTGVCIMRMEEGLDTGPYCMRSEVEVGSHDISQLSALLAEEGARLLVEALEAVSAGTATWTDQSTEGITYAEKIGKGELDPTPQDTVAVFDRKVRASSGAHPAKAVVAGRALTFEATRPMSSDAPREAASLTAGRVAFVEKKLFLGVSDGVVEVLQVKPDGKKSMDARSFASGIQGIKRNDETMWGTR